VWKIKLNNLTQTVIAYYILTPWPTCSRHKVHRE